MTLARLSLLFTCTVSALFFSDCNSKTDIGNGGEDDGFESVFTNEGVLLQKIKHIDGDKERIVRDYYKNGQLFQEIHYVKYRQHGVVKQFYEDGKPYTVTPYENGKLHGTVIKYRKDGTLAFEAPYYKGQPCVGLKEYLLDGTLKQKYPKIVITPIDKMLAEELYSLRLTISDNTRSVEFFEGGLTDGKYIGEDADKILSEKGAGLWSQYVPSGGFYMKQLHFLAKMKTPQGNYYITDASYNVVAENR